MTTPSTDETNAALSTSTEDILQRLRETSVTDSPFTLRPSAFGPGVAEALAEPLADAYHAIEVLYAKAKEVGDIQSALIFVLTPTLAIANFENVAL